MKAQIVNLMGKNLFSSLVVEGCKDLPAMVFSLLMGDEPIQQIYFHGQAG